MPRNLISLGLCLSQIIRAGRILSRKTNSCPCNPPRRAWRQTRLGISVSISSLVRIAGTPLSPHPLSGPGNSWLWVWLSLVLLQGLRSWAQSGTGLGLPELLQVLSSFPSLPSIPVGILGTKLEQVLLFPAAELSSSDPQVPPGLDVLRISLKQECPTFVGGLVASPANC